MKIKHYLLFIVLLFNIGISQVAAIPIDCGKQSYIPDQECDALIDLYNYTNGSEWTDSSRWTEFTDPCTTWHGVSCEQGVYCTPTNPPICYVTNRVSNLHLSTNNLNGSIPSSIGNLTNLAILEFNYNQLSGSIPLSIGNLTKLANLNLNDNQLTGTIPSTIGKLTNISGLNLFNNQLIGSIPSEIGNLTNLNHITLANNQLSGHIPPEIGNLTSLNSLYLNDNQLCGEIPTNLTYLTNLLNDYGIHIKNNYLYTNDSVLDAFLVKKGGDWKSSQGARCPADAAKTIMYQIIIMGASMQ